MTLDWILERLAEASTWRGITAILTGLGIALSPELAAQITAAGLGLIGLINVFRKEKKA